MTLNIYSMLIIGAFLVFAVALIIYVVYREIEKSRKKKQFLEGIVDQHGMSMGAAKTLDKISESHKRIVQNKKYIGYDRYGRKLDNSRVHAAHSHDFYMLNRWIKRLNDAKRQNSYIMYSVIDSIIQEMSNKADEYTLKPGEREEILELVEQPDHVLRQYDSLYI